VTTRAHVFRISLLTAAVLGASAGDRPAAAQEAADAEREAFKDALKSFDEKNYEEAIARFSKVLASTSSPNARLFIARSLRELGRLPEAHDEMSRTLRDATAMAETEAKYIKTRDAAAAELAELTPRVARVTVAVADPPAGLAVTLGERTLEEGLLGKPMALAPGEVVVRAEAPGHDPFEKRLRIGAGGSETIAIALRKSGEAGDKPDRPEDKPDEAGGGIPALFGTGIALAVVGVGGFVTFATAGTLSNQKYDEVFEACGGTRCTDPALANDIDEGRTLDLVANIGLGAGIAGVAAGVSMILAGWDWSGATASAGPGGAWLGWRTAF
jgi:hypothetical protein